jgi:DNA-binding LytR/AlgR family response regulator
MPHRGPSRSRDAAEPTRIPRAAAQKDGLRALLVDDEPPALAELDYLLGLEPRIQVVATARSGSAALESLAHTAVDVVFCDIKMPGLDGIALVEALGRLPVRPQVVFVTAYDEHAVDAFDLRATDYVMKPVRAERLQEAVDRVGEAHLSARGRGDEVGDAPDESIPVELGGVTRFILRSQVRYARAQGDYARLHTRDGSHLVRVPLSTLEERWAAAGFLRIHRSTVVNTSAIDEVRVDRGRVAVRIGDTELQVSRRHARALRDRIASPAALRSRAPD